MNFRGSCFRALAFATYLVAVAYPARLGSVPFPYGGGYGGLAPFGGVYGARTPVPAYAPPLFR